MYSKCFLEHNPALGGAGGCNDNNYFITILNFCPEVKKLTFCIHCHSLLKAICIFMVIKHSNKLLFHYAAQILCIKEGGEGGQSTPTFANRWGEGAQKVG